jgi:hypothetical protein
MSVLLTTLKGYKQIPQASKTPAAREHTTYAKPLYQIEGDGDPPRLKVVRCESRRPRQAYKIHKSRFAALVVKEYA